MSYPTLRLDGQYTLKRVLTLPNNAAAALTQLDDLNKPVTMNAAGEVVLTSAVQTPFWGILRAVESDGFVSVDFSGVHVLTTDTAISAGTAVTINDGLVVAATNPDTAAVSFATNAVALTATTGTAGESVSVFILN